MADAAPSARRVNVSKRTAWTLGVIAAIGGGYPATSALLEFFRPSIVAAARLETTESAKAAHDALGARVDKLEAKIDALPAAVVDELERRLP